MGIAGMRKQVKLVMFIIIIAFVGGFLFFQLGGITMSLLKRGRRNPNVIGKVGSHPITLQEYEKYIQRAMARFEEEGRRPTQREMERIREYAWQQIVSDKVFEDYLKREGIGVTDEEVFEIMRSNPPPQLMEREELKTDGKFDLRKYQQVLADPRNRVFFEAYKQDLKRIVPKQKLHWDIASSYRLTRGEINEILNREGTSIEATYLFFGPEVIKEIPQPTEAELKSYYQTHKDKYQRPEERRLKFVLFPTLPSPSDSLQAKETIEEAYEDIKDGEDFYDVGLDYSDSGIDTVGGNLGELAEETRKILENLKVSEVSPPFRTSFGWVIAKVIQRKGDNIRIARIMVHLQPSRETLDSLRALIEDFRKEAKKVPLKSLCKKFGIDPPRDMPPVTPKGLYFPFVPDESPIITFAQKAKQGDISYPIRGKSGYFLFKLIKVIPAHLATMEEVKGDVKRDWIKEKTKELIENYARAVYGRLKQGISLERVAKEDSKIIIKKERFSSFYDALRRKGPEFAGALYALKENNTSGVVMTDRGGFILRCDKREKKEIPDPNIPLKAEMDKIAKEISKEIFKPPRIEDFRAEFFY